MSTHSEEILVEVAYALPTEQIILPIKVNAGITAEAAVKQSGILTKFPEINLAENKIGIFGKLTQLDTVLRDKDRIEIYRPLIADPKEVRRQRAEAGKVMKKGGGDIAKKSYASQHFCAKTQLGIYRRPTSRYNFVLEARNIHHAFVAKCTHIR